MKAIHLSIMLCFVFACATVPTKSTSTPKNIYLDSQLSNVQAAGWLAYAASLGQWDDLNNNKNGINLYEREVYAREKAAIVWSELKQKQSDATEYDLDTMLNVKDAGFMREYVWYFFKRPEWTIPTGLKLDNFNEWREQNIPDYKPTTKGNLTYKGYFDSKLCIHFPSKLGDLEYQGRNTYENPGLGYSVRYSDDSFFKIDIYVYDNNISDIGSGIESKRIRNEFASVLMVFSYMEKLGKYKDVKLIEKGEKKIGKTTFLWAQYTYKQAKSAGSVYPGSRLSDTYLVGKNNLFLKVRLTMNEEDANKEKEAKNKFLKDLAGLLSEGS